MAERFYCPDLPPGDQEFTLEGDEAKHLARVRRVGEGEVVEVFDGRGLARRARVVALEKGRVRLLATGTPLPGREAAVALTLATAVPKGERFDWLVEKATELGVSRLVPLLTGRSVVDPRLSKLERIRRAVIEAAKQCGRNSLMEVAAPVAWPELLRGETGPGARLVCHPGAAASPGWPKVWGAPAAVVAVGPEGGFTSDEVAEATGAGWTTVGLGATLLRVETAGLVACARVIALNESQPERGG